MKALTLILVAALLSACAFDPVAYEELRKQEHEDHMRQGG